MNNNAIEEKARQIYGRLLEFYGRPIWRQPLEALDELVSTILSQNTNDKNRDMAFERLRAAYPTWEAVRDAPEQAVIEAIRPAGLANQKGPRIQQVLREITSQRGELDLSFLRMMGEDDAREWLTQFKGVGLKTAAIVMQFALDLPAFPVDTHIYRVSGRLGLRPERMNVDQAHAHLAGLFAPETYGPAHLNLIRLGREVCAARKPRCPVCPVRQWCDYFLTPPVMNEEQQVNRHAPFNSGLI
jgi:endonuclease-3